MKYIIQFKSLSLKIAIISAALIVVAFSSGSANAVAPLPTNPQNGSVGMSGTIPTDPPTASPSIISPVEGAVITTSPVVVTGSCTGNYIVKLFNNGVFAGSAQCKNNGFSITANLFVGTNSLVARLYDALDQAGPDSNKVVVTFNNTNGGSVSTLNVTSNYATRGADPKQVLTWPIIISGGVGPYAISVDWGDNSPSDIYIDQVPGEFNIKHTYEQAGVYRVLVKVTDINKNEAYLQLTAICNGVIKGDSNVNGSSVDKLKANFFYYFIIPLVIAIPIAIVSFLLGWAFAVKRVREKIRRGEWIF